MTRRWPGLAEAVETRRPRLTVALNSSRPAASVDATLASVFPAHFKHRAIITAMGTQVRVDGQMVPSWIARFDDWPRQRIFELVTSLGHRAHNDEYQTPHKASFAVPRGPAQDEVTAALQQADLPCRIIASGSDDLDILPPGGGKDHATLFLAQHLGVDPATRLVVAGDSANDLAMFNVASRAIAVGNAPRRAARRHAPPPPATPPRQGPRVGCSRASSTTACGTRETPLTQTRTSRPPDPGPRTPPDPRSMNVGFI